MPTGHEEEGEHWLKRRPEFRGYTIRHSPGSRGPEDFQFIDPDTGKIKHLVQMKYSRRYFGTDKVLSGIAGGEQLYELIEYAEQVKAKPWVLFCERNEFWLESARKLWNEWGRRQEKQLER